MIKFLISATFVLVFLFIFVLVSSFSSSSLRLFLSFWWRSS